MHLPDVMYLRTLEDNRTMSLKLIIVFLLLSFIGITLSKYVENENKQAYLRGSRFSNKGEIIKFLSLSVRLLDHMVCLALGRKQYFSNSFIIHRVQVEEKTAPGSPF